MWYLHEGRYINLDKVSVIGDINSGFVGDLELETVYYFNIVVDGNELILEYKEEKEALKALEEIKNYCIKGGK